MSTTTSTLQSNKNYHFGEIIGQYRSQPNTYEGKTFKNIDIYWIDYWPNFVKEKIKRSKIMKNKNKEKDWKIEKKKEKKSNCRSSKHTLQSNKLYFKK